MSDPIAYVSATPRLALPHLFAAQAQKEFIVNEAHARLDLLLHCSVEGQADDPPAEPAEGETWIVGAAPTGAWAGRAEMLAGWQAGTWIFVQPAEGMRVHDRATQSLALYRGEWIRPVAPENPTEGTTIDTQARAAIGNLIETLRNAGIFPAQ